MEQVIIMVRLDMFSSISTTPLSEFKTISQEFIMKRFMPIPENTVAMLASAGGVGKTNLAIQCASHYVAETGKKCLVWFSEDEGAVIRGRYDKMVSEFIVEDIAPQNILYINTEPIQFATIEDKIFKANYKAMNEIRQDCKDNEVGFIIIDPLLAFYGGSENDNSQARIFMQPFLEWAKQDSITILFIHHAKKGDGGGVRGAGAFVDAVRTLYELDYIRLQDGNVDFDSKDKGMRRITLKKDNRGAYEHFVDVYGYQEGEVRVTP